MRGGQQDNVVGAVGTILPSRAAVQVMLPYHRYILPLDGRVQGEGGASANGCSTDMLLTRFHKEFEFQDEE